MKNKIFQSSVKIWVNQFIYTLIGIIIAVILLILFKNMLDIKTMEHYEKYVQMCMVVLGFIGLIFGTNRIYADIRENRAYLSRGVKYLVLLYQAIAFAGFAAICIANRLGVVFFVGGYLTIFLQFLLNYYYTKYNNHKFRKKVKKEKVVDNSDINQGVESTVDNSDTNQEVQSINEGIIDIEKLK